MNKLTEKVFNQIRKDGAISFELIDEITKSKDENIIAKLSNKGNFTDV